MPSVILAGTTTGTALSLTSDTSGELQIRTNNGATTAMTLTTGGNVGVGTTSPVGRLQVSGLTFLYNEGSTTSRLLLRNTTTGPSAGGFDIQQVGNDTTVFNGSSGYLALGTTNTEQMRITSAGNVGIGTSSPAGRFHVVGTADQIRGGDGTTTSFLGGSAGIGYTGTLTNHAFTFYTNGAERMRIDISGNVGIGVTSLSERFQVAGTGDVKAEISTNATNRVAVRWKNASVSYIWQIDGNDFRVIDETPSAERLRITSTGLLQFNSGYGSVATAFGCRAWVNFDGTGTVSIRGSGNVSSITDNGAGNYNVNFTTAMPNVNYAITSATQAATTNLFSSFVDTLTVGSFRIVTVNASNVVTDTPTVCTAVFR
jgi:hypothetical protein